MKPRPPLSVDAALARIAGQVPGGWAAMAARCARVEGTVRAWGDPDRGEQVPVDCAIVLDLLFMEQGGEGAPIFEAYALKLELDEVSRYADRFELHSLTIDVIREGGEAHAALVRACRPGSGNSERLAALREVTDAFETIKRVLPVLDTTGPEIIVEAHQRAPP